MTEPRRIEAVTIGAQRLPGELVLPDAAAGLVVFAHGSGSSHLSPRNVFVAAELQARRLGTLLFDLLTESEAEDRANVFDIGLLGARVGAALDWIDQRADLARFAVGLFGASTGAAAALVAAAERDRRIAAVVSRGGRPDLAGRHLARVTAATLLIVGGDDDVVLQLNRRAFAELRCEKRLEVVARATHLFEEEGALERVARLAADWFVRYLVSAIEGRPRSGRS